MKTLLTWSSASLITGALLDPMIQSGLGRPVPWGRDLLMAGAGLICIWLMIKYRRNL